MVIDGRALWALIITFLIIYMIHCLISIIASPSNIGPIKNYFVFEMSIFILFGYWIVYYYYIISCLFFIYTSKIAGPKQWSEMGCASFIRCGSGRLYGFYYLRYSSCHLHSPHYPVLPILVYMEYVWSHIMGKIFKHILL